ncbi:hypothetical protein FQZ97_1016120 [compost metagenome]
MPWRSHSSRTPLKYPGTGVSTPAVAPPTVSATKAITFSPPSWSMAADNSATSRSPYCSGVSSARRSRYS